MGGRRWRHAAAAALAALACRSGGAASTAPAVLREQRVYPGGGPGGDASLAPGWSNFSWRGSYDLNSTAVAPFRGTACTQALPQLYGALSFYTRTPFFGPSSPEGYDAVDFWMRGPSALTITVFVLPAAGSAGGSVSAAAAAPLTAVETVGRNVAAYAVDTNPFGASRSAKPAPSSPPQGGASPAVAAMQEGGATPGVPPPPLERWTLFRISLGELGASSWERINWKNDAVSPNAEFYVDEVRLVKFAPQPPAAPVVQQAAPPPPSPAAPSPPPPTEAPPPPRASPPPPTASPPPPSSPPSVPPTPVPSPQAPPASTQSQPAAPAQAAAPAEQTSSLMENLRGVTGSSSEAALESSTQITERVRSRGGLWAILQQAGLSLGGGGGGGSGGGVAFGSQMGAAAASGALAPSAPGYGPGYASPDPAGGLGGGTQQQGGFQQGGMVQQQQGSFQQGTTQLPGGVSLQNGGAGVGAGGVSTVGAGGVAGAGGVTTVGGGGVGVGGGVGAGGVAGGAAVVTNSASFYGGAYGGSGIFLPGRSVVRVYVFPACVSPELAVVWPGCWCALCYIDIDPGSVNVGAQRLLNDYALVANAVAANELQRAATQAQRLAGAQAVQANLNARLVGTAFALYRDAQTTAGLLFAARQRSRQEVVNAVYGVRNPTYAATWAQVNPTGTTVIVNGR